MPLTEENGTRKLAAIMFTDIKGFSKKMGENEVAAMQILHTHDTMMKAVVAKYGGTVIKSIGDSFMVDFSSAVNAVKCAIDAQENFWNHNKEKSEFEKIEIRVGVHLGDVITVGNDIYGDGVNIAARIEAITEPTRICISQDVYNQVKKKMQIRVYNIGSIELKNIDEPVEVFEILLDSIPELSEPSQSALQSPTRKKADAITKQEEEEARQVEVAKKKADEERQKEEEKQRKAQEIFQKAEAYFQAGAIDNAEAELKEVYKIVSMHYGAQMLTLQIEEERTKHEEEERRHRIKEEKRRKEEERKQHIQDCLQQAMQHVEHDQFNEALAAVQKVYTIDPNNAEAKKLEEQIRQAERAKAELDQLQAAEAERQAQQEALRQRQATAEELAKTKTAVEEKPRIQARHIKSRLKLYAGIGAAVIVLAVGAFLASSYLSKPPSFAVFPLQNGSLRGADNYIGTTFSSLLANGLAHGQQTTVISTSSTASVDPNTASAFDVQYVLQGTVQVSGSGVTANVKLLEVKNQQTVWESNFVTNVSKMNEVAAKAAEAILKQLNIESPPLTAQQASVHTEANELYFHGVALIHQPKIGSIEEGINLLQQSLQVDSAFALGRAALGEGLLLHFKRSGEKDARLLTDVTQSCSMALQFNKNTALAYQVLGEAYRLTQQFDRSRDVVMKSLSLQPGNADCYRQLAMLSLIEGNVEKALEHVTMATKLDPRSYESYFVKGLVHHYKREFAEAVQAYEDASLTGAQDSLLTVDYKFSAWNGIDAEDKIISYCNQLMNRASIESKLELTYLIAQAQQLSGKQESLEKLKEGIEAGRIFLEQNPTNVTVTAYLALMHSRSGNFELAQKEMASAVALNPKSAQLLYWQARVFAIQNKKANALEALAKAVAMEYNFSEILNPDFNSIAKDPDFAATIARK
ncbi:MAG: hypothetical protein HY088_07605, partial [Ignavibacteriales bacterium]|nr:hypothetical protein [Ignavibacteriales bacterium]